jgi:hypothetical protein
MKIVRETLTTLTQCMLLPGTELHFDDVIFYLKKGMGGVLINSIKRFNLNFNPKTHV